MNLIAPAESLSFVGDSRYSTGIRADIARVGPEDCHVLVIGPTGTGKQVVTTALHAASGRRTLVRLAAPQLEGDVMRGELFGSTKGAYTDADKDRSGFIEAAHGGTLVIDDTDTWSRRLQGMLLDVIEGRALWPVGGGRSYLSNIRCIVCVQADPDRLVRAGFWRADLLYRLDQERIVLKPLGEHLDDIPALCMALLDRLALTREQQCPQLSRAAMARLMSHHWPGNVRELDSVLQRAFRRARWAAGGAAVEWIGREHLALPSVSAAGRRGKRVTLTREAMEQAIRGAAGSLRGAASVLGVSTTTARRRARELGV